MHSRTTIAAALALAVAALLLIAPQPAAAKSLYVNADLNAGSPIRAYDIQAAPNYLVYQATSNTTGYGGAGLAIDTDSETLFVTFEGAGWLKIVDATTLHVPSTSVTAPNARNLAGIVVDQGNQKVYTVDRNTNHLYVYSWNAATNTLTNDITAPPFYVPLAGLYAPGSHGAGAHGIALDEANGLLYVADVTNDVKVYSTTGWSQQPSVHVAGQKVMAVALDTANGLLYSGNAYPPYGCTGDLVQTDLTTSAESEVYVRSLTGWSTDCVIGIAVDPLTSLVYVTTGNQGSGGSDRIIVFDSTLADLHHTGDIGNPTGIVVPGKEISYNPLDLSKNDGLATGECVSPGSALTYTLCYNNAANSYDVTNVALEDTLPSEVAFVSASGGGVFDGTDKVNWSLGTVPAGSSGGCETVTVAVSGGVTPDSDFVNAVTISSSETPPTTVNRSTHVCANSPPVADADGPYSGFEGSPVAFDGSASSDPDGDTLTYSWAYGDGDYGSGVNPSHTYADNDTYTVDLTVSDGSLSDSDQTTAVIANVAPDLTALVGPSDPVAINVSLTVGGPFTDPGTADTHTAQCDWGDTTSSAAAVTQGAGFGSISASHVYTVAGVYTIACTVTDDDGGFDTEIFQYAVVYDPDDGFVTGGGWIWSPPGAYADDTSLEGHANFGFVSKYKKGQSTPTGSTEFQFQAGDLNFHSSSYDWLVIAGPKAMYRGTGTINGGGNYGFLLSAVDAKLTPSTDVDRFRIKIWDKDNSDAIVYDNQMGADMDADPTTAISGGSIVIHKK